MDHYLDIRLLPDPEFPPKLLMNALYAKLHRGLVERGGGQIGLGFPEYTAKGLGERLRLHGTQQGLTQFMAGAWLKGMADHCAVGPIQPVPPAVQHRVFRRVQADSSPERLRRRRIARGASPEQAQAAIPDHAGKRLELPSILLNSQSTGQRFLLFIERGPLQAQPTPGVFSAYGLSPSATVPHF